LVVLDTSVILAACLDPKMDAKADLAAQVLKTLEQAGVRPAITEGIRAEVETKLYDRVGQMVDGLRALASSPPPLPFESGQTALEFLEPLFAKLRRDMEGSSGALQLLESRLAAILEDSPITTSNQWMNLARNVAVEATAMLVEIQRRQDALGLDALAKAGTVDHEMFRQFVPKSDLEHIAVLAATSEARSVKILFVTMDANLHGVRDEIAKAAPNLIVTMPVYLRRQLSRLAGGK